jgi:hypothetical protein
MLSTLFLIPCLFINSAICVDWLDKWTSLCLCISVGGGYVDKEMFFSGSNIICFTFYIHLRPIYWLFLVVNVYLLGQSLPSQLSMRTFTQRLIPQTDASLRQRLPAGAPILLRDSYILIEIILLILFKVLVHAPECSYGIWFLALRFMCFFFSSLSVFVHIFCSNVVSFLQSLYIIEF